MQQKYSQLVFVSVLVTLCGAFSLLPAAGPQAEAKKEEKQTVAQKCLACHGPYDKLAEKTAGSVSTPPTRAACA